MEASKQASKQVSKKERKQEQERAHRGHGIKGPADWPVPAIGQRSQPAIDRWVVGTETR